MSTCALSNSTIIRRQHHEPRISQSSSWACFAVVYNIKAQETRFVTLLPSDSWGGAGLLGVTIRLDNYGGADERLIRVLTVEHNSPAAIAGLVEEQDYLLGTVSESLEDTTSLANLLHTSVDQVIEFYVYNTNSDVVRVVPLMPTWSWGGRGLLGAEVGTGYLHRLPHATRSTGGSSIARKVRYIQSKPDSKDNLSALEHEPQLELESEESGGPITLASPDDVADMSLSKADQRLQKVESSTNNEHISPSGETTNEVQAPATAVENTTEREATEGTLERQASTAAELFAGPPPDTAEVDLR